MLTILASLFLIDKKVSRVSMCSSCCISLLNDLYFFFSKTWIFDGRRMAFYVDDLHFFGRWLAFIGLSLAFILDDDWQFLIDDFNFLVNDLHFWTMSDIFCSVTGSFWSVNLICLVGYLQFFWTMTNWTCVLLLVDSPNVTV